VTGLPQQVTAAQQGVQHDEQRLARQRPNNGRRTQWLS
jgi:hypothetical protein